MSTFRRATRDLAQKAHFFNRRRGRCRSVGTGSRSSRTGRTPAAPPRDAWRARWRDARRSRRAPDDRSRGPAGAGVRRGHRLLHRGAGLPAGRGLAARRGEAVGRRRASGHERNLAPPRPRGDAGTGGACRRPDRGTGLPLPRDERLRARLQRDARSWGRLRRDAAARAVRYGRRLPGLVRQSLGPDRARWMRFELSHALEVLERTPRTFRALLGGLPEAWTTPNEGPDTFSAFDNLGHLVHGERTDWIPRARIILAQGAERRFEPYDRFAQYTESRGKSTAQLLDEFERLRAGNLATLREWSLSERELALEGEHPSLGTVTLRQLLS